MKNIIFIGGPMGIGKTTVTKLVAKQLDHSVFLDGDWCWDMNPFVINDENKKMVLSNIQYLLNSFLCNSNIENILFCWVMDEQHIIDSILEKLAMDNAKFHSISLISSEEKLKRNIEKDIKLNLRTREDIDRSIERIKKYDFVDSIKIDISNMDIEKTSSKICSILNGNKSNSYKDETKGKQP